MHRRTVLPFALALAASAVVACGPGEATGFRYTPSSLVLDGLGTAVVRVYGDSDALAYCGSYPVDEARAPGDTISLVSFASTLALSPTHGTTGRVRIVFEVYAEGVAVSPCDGTTPKSKPLARKVVVAPYAPGRVLDVKTVVEPSCLGVVSCDERTSTCERGVCVDASQSGAEGVVGSGPCFAIDTCPSLVRATRVAVCTYETPVPTTTGFVAASFALPSGDAAGEEFRGISVLEPGDVTFSGRTLTLTGRMCELATSGYVDTLYYGYECTPPNAGAPVCARATAATVDQVIANVATAAGGGADAGPLEGGSGDATTDARRDATADGPDGDAVATVDAGTDTGDASGDGGIDDGTVGDSGSTSFGLAASASVPCPTAPECSTGDGQNVCCIAGPGATPLCTGTPGCAGAERLRCDDSSDCESGKICCRRNVGVSAVESSCLRPVDCFQSPGASQLCSTADGRCETGSFCSRVRDGAGAASDECVYFTPVARVRCDRDAVTPSDCTAGTPVCCSALVPAENTCVQTPSECEGTDILECDDMRDCPSGRVCCATVGTRLSTKCTTDSVCVGVAMGTKVCSDADTRCFGGLTCSANRIGPFSRRCE
ncbi:MAG: hypothetical protein U0169_14070 [Polyangiaceae bacterium]